MSALDPRSRARPAAPGSRPREARRSVLAIALLVGLALQPAAARADTYTLGPQDKLRVKLVEWRPGNGEAVDWEALSDTYTVNAGGRLSIPILGDLPASGRTTGEVAAAIGDAMKRKIGLAQPPEISVEIETYRPVYILGAVDKPGSFPFRPDLTALQAVGLAGGIYRPSDAGLLRLERDRIVAQGLFEESRLTLQRSLVRMARLEGELANRTGIALPKELDGADVGRVVATEAAIASARTEAFSAQVKASENLKALLDDQIRTLDAKIASQAKQVDISQRELQSYGALAKQGLSIASRQFGLERTVAEVEGRKIDYEIAALNARQDRHKAEQALINLRQERQDKIVTEINQTQGAIALARAKVAAQSALVKEATVTAPGLVLDREQSAAGRRPVLVVTRREAGSDKTTTTVVSESTRLEPGDVLQVEMPNPGHPEAARVADAQRAPSEFGPPVGDEAARRPEPPRAEGGARAPSDRLRATAEDPRDYAAPARRGR